MLADSRSQRFDAPGVYSSVRAGQMLALVLLGAYVVFNLAKLQRQRPRAETRAGFSTAAESAGDHDAERRTRAQKRR